MTALAGLNGERLGWLTMNGFLLLRRRAALVAVSCWLVVGAVGAATSSAASRPILLANVRCATPCTKLVGIYKVRPRHVYLIDADGGTLTLYWSSWTSGSASGHGDAHAVGAGTSTHTPVTAKATRVRHGRFTRLTLTFHKTSTAVEHLKLGTSNGGPAWVRF
jgi:hypothetical protein